MKTILIFFEDFTKEIEALDFYKINEEDNVRSVKINYLTLFSSILKISTGEKMKTLILTVCFLFGVLGNVNAEVNMDCVAAVKSEYPYPNIATAAQSCGENVSMECVKIVKSEYPYPRTTKAAESCQ